MNPRQISLTFWACVALAWALTQPQIRKSLMNVLKTALKPQLLIPACASVIWNAGVLVGLARLQLWTPSLWWDTAVFVFGGTTALIWRMRDSKDYSWRFYRGRLFEALGVSVLLGVLVSNYTYGLVVELILVPWLVTLGGVKAVADRDDKFAVVAKLVDALIALTGLAMIVQMVVGAVAEGSAFWSMQTAQSLLLVFLLTGAYLPFMVAIRTWMTYDLAFIPLRLGEKKRLSVRLRAKLRIVLRHGLNLAELERFRTGVGHQLRFATTKDAVDAVFERS